VRPVPQAASERPLHNHGGKAPLLFVDRKAQRLAQCERRAAVVKAPRDGAVTLFLQ
jgi:hypothetical protein